jgi:hypothetical protein
MIYDSKKEAIKYFNEAHQSVAEGGDFSPVYLMDKIKTAGGLEALGIDPKEMEALNRRGAAR